MVFYSYTHLLLFVLHQCVWEQNVSNWSKLPICILQRHFDLLVQEAEIVIGDSMMKKYNNSMVYLDIAKLLFSSSTKRKTLAYATRLSEEDNKNRWKATILIFKIACSKERLMWYIQDFRYKWRHYLQLRGFFRPDSISFTWSATLSSVCCSMWLDRRSITFLSEAERFLSRSSWVNSWIFTFSFYKNIIFAEACQWKKKS